jgi:glycosyltransferase involved in cell wall biosynthesis
MNCYNCDRFLEEAIDSVYAQSYKNWEIIFWDNASTDSSSLIAKGYDDRLKYFLSKETKPLGLARNFALEEASGTYISFLDCDDVYLPRKIEIQVSNMQTDNSVLSYGSWIEIDENGLEIKKHKIQRKYPPTFETLLKKYDVNFQTLMINKKLVNKGELVFDKNLTFSPDYELVMRIAFYYPKLLVISDYLSKYRIHSDSLSSKCKQEKRRDFESIIESQKKMKMDSGVRDFDLLVKILKIRMKFRDSLSERKFVNLFLYLLLLIFLFSKYKIMTIIRIK